MTTIILVLIKPNVTSFFSIRLHNTVKKPLNSL